MVFELKDGTAVRIRPVRPTDKALLAEGLSRLSEETVRRRFLSPKPVLSASELRYLTEVDGQDHVALVAVLADDPDSIVGAGRFVRLAGDPETAEAAVVVADPYQGKGLGRRLGLMLADAARTRGVRRFSATMYSDNSAAHRLMGAIAGRLEQGPYDAGVHEVVAQLAA